jgi:hypothetical protein
MVALRLEEKGPAVIDLGGRSRVFTRFYIKS